MKLFLCEKPSQAKDIAAVLGNASKGQGCIDAGGHKLTWCIGHLLEQDEPDRYDEAYKKWNMTDLPIIPNPWKLHVKSNVKKQYSIVSKLVKNAKSIVIATDADREGECIAWEILDRANFKGTVERLWLSALDSASVNKALSNLKPSDHTFPLYHAALARQRADWLVGMNLTRAYTIYGNQSGLDGVLSVGRVQTPSLALIVNRDHAISSFESIPFYVNWISLETASGAFRASIHSAFYKGAEGFDSEGRCCKSLTI